MDKFEIIDRGFGKYLVLAPGWPPIAVFFRVDLMIILP